MNGSLRPQITASTIPDNGYALLVHHFHDWPMDIDREGDGGFLSEERPQTVSEDEGDSDESDEEDVEGALPMLTIDSGNEPAFEKDEEESVDEEVEDLDDPMHDRTDED